MEGLIPILILFFVINTISKALKKTKQAEKKPLTQQQIEATKARPAAVRQAVKTAVKSEDYRFPSKAKPAKNVTPQEGRTQDSMMNTVYTPMTPSKNMNSAFSANMEGISMPYAEGSGDKPEGITAAPVASRTETSGVTILPPSFTGSALVQAVVMSEILKRPRASR